MVLRKASLRTGSCLECDDFRIGLYGTSTCGGTNRLNLQDTK